MVFVKNHTGLLKATLIQLEYIIAVDTHRHFGKAAESCFVTQPTLSMQIQKLEESLGVIIFDRSKQPVVPTDIGKQIIAQAREVISQARRIDEIISEEKEEVAGELKIAIIPTLAPYLLPLFISSFLEKYPKISLTVEEMLTDRIVKSLQNDQIDIGLLVTPLAEQGLAEKPLFYEEFLVYASERHPISSKKEVTGDDLDLENLWLLNEGHCFRNQVLNICNHDQRIGRTPFRYESGSLESLRRIVDRQRGLTLLPELATLDLDKDARKKLRGFAAPVPTREVSLVLRRSFLKRRMVEALHQEILESLPPLIKSRKADRVVNWKS